MTRRDGQRRHRRRRSLSPGVLAAVVVAAAAVSGAAILAANLVACGVGPGASAVAAEPVSMANDTQAATVFLIRDERLVPVSRTVAGDGDLVLDRVEALLDGPTAAERREGLHTAIPADSRVVDCSVRGGVAVVAFDGAFVSGSAGVADEPTTDSGDHDARLAQVTYTATAVTGIHQVEIVLPGAEPRRYTRDDFESPRSTEETTPAPTPTASASGRAGTAGATSPLDPDDMGAVQEHLVELRYLPNDAVSGSYDDRTAQAVMAFQAWEGLVPDGVVGELTAARLPEADPPLPVGDGEGRRVEIHRDKGVLLLADGDAVVRAVHTSTGETGDEPPHATPSGRFLVTAKALKDWSEPYEVWMPYACYFNGGIAIHGADAVPPWPASHGCVRVPQVEAPVVYRFVSVGTPVDVY